MWLGQNRAEKAVDDLFDGMTLDSNSNSGIRATKSSNITNKATSSNPINNNTTNINNNNLLASNVLPNGGEYKKLNIFANTPVPSVNTNSTTNTEFLSAPIIDTNGHLDLDTDVFDNGNDGNDNDASMPLSCPTPVKIKKDDECLSPLSNRSHNSNSSSTNNISTSIVANIGTVPALAIAGGHYPPANTNSTHQPVARKRTAYQALVGSSSNIVTINSSNSTQTNGPTPATILSESSPEVSSSQNTVISPVPSLESSEIDLELWDLDIHESSASNSSGSNSI